MDDESSTLLEHLGGSRWCKQWNGREKCLNNCESQIIHSEGRKRRPWLLGARQKPIMRKQILTASLWLCLILVTIKLLIFAFFWGVQYVKPHSRKSNRRPASPRRSRSRSKRITHRSWDPSHEGAHSFLPLSRRRLDPINRPLIYQHSFR